MFLSEISTLSTHATEYGHGPWGGGPGFWPIFPIIWLVLLAGLITTAVILGRRRNRRAGSLAGRSRLAERYASGEINEDEYQQRLDTLRRLEK